MALYDIMLKVDNYEPDLGVSRFEVSVDDKKLKNLSDEELDAYLKEVFIRAINKSIGWSAIRKDH